MARISEDDVKNYQNELNGEWFTLKNDGDVARVQFLHANAEDLQIYAVHKVDVGGKERYVDCIRQYNESIDNCPLCAAGFPVKPVRFVLMFQHDDQKVKIWERGKQFIAKLQGLMNRYTPLNEYVFEIERHGKAGDKDTKYEVFPMDRVDPYDLSEVEVPELLGGLILDKSYDDMNYYIDNGVFPSTGEDEPETPRRGAPTRAGANNSSQGSRRVQAGTTAPAAPGPRRGTTPAPAPSSSRAGSRRGGAETF